MNSIVKIHTQEPTMSSREIADLVESKHGHVMTSIQRLMGRGVIGEYAAVRYTHEQNGQEYFEYHIEKRDSYIIVAQLSPEFTARLVDRWQELESRAPSLPDFNNPVEAARAWADAKESEMAALESLESARPSIEFVERYTQSAGSQSLTQTAKDLKYKPRQFTHALERDGFLYRTRGALTPYQQHLDSGVFDILSGENGGHAYFQTVITPKGKSFFAHRYASELMSEANLKKVV